MDRILDILNEKKLTKTAFADLVGVKNQNVNAMLKNPTRETYERIAAFPGRSIVPNAEDYFRVEEAGSTV